MQVLQFRHTVVIYEKRVRDTCSQTAGAIQQDTGEAATLHTSIGCQFNHWTSEHKVTPEPLYFLQQPEAVLLQLVLHPTQCSMQKKK